MPRKYDLTGRIPSHLRNFEKIRRLYDHDDNSRVSCEFEPCPAEGDWQDVAHGKFHLDHIVPTSRRGEDTWDNIQVLCARCNNIKGNGTMEELLEKWQPITIHSPILVPQAITIVAGGREITFGTLPYKKDERRRDLYGQHSRPLFLPKH